jgi:hypothetical protein
MEEPMIPIILLHAILLWQEGQPNLPPDGWHLATHVECSAEERREAKAMSKEGIIGDPSITVGAGEGSWDKEGNPDFWSEDPCGYASDSKPTKFQTRYKHNGKDITECEYYHKDKCRAEQQVPPFDVPPVVTKGPDSHFVTSCAKDKEGNEGPCFSDYRELTTHIACADKSRFLLQSEDGKYHCLALTSKP